MEAATVPFPTEDITPPVTKMYFGTLKIEFAVIIAFPWPSLLYIWREIRASQFFNIDIAFLNLHLVGFEARY